MKIKIEKSRLFVAALFMAGLSLLLYPFVANQWNNYRHSQLISTYETAVANMESSGEVDYEEQWHMADDYNQSLLPSILPDSFAVAEATEEDRYYMSCLNLTGDGMMGYIEIPKIDVKLPIFHTTEEDVLQKAAGHLKGSSLPVGGESTHAVISAHRGLPSATLFTDLDKLVEGDHFLLRILDDTLCYQVDKISVVKPDETEALSVEKGEDLVTLLTCTPYGVNSHRLFVRGHRVEYVESAMEEVPKALLGVSAHTSYLLWVIAGLAVTGIFILMLYLRDKKQGKKEPKTEKEPKAAKKESKKTTKKETKKTAKKAPKKAAKKAPETTTPPETKPRTRREYVDYTDNESYVGYKDYLSGGDGDGAIAAEDEKSQ